MTDWQQDFAFREARSKRYGVTLRKKMDIPDIPDILT
jgi:hypothetical protein